MNENRFIIEKIESTGTGTKVSLKGTGELLLRPFVYIKPHDILEFIPSPHNSKEIYKVFEDRATKEIKRIKIHPAYERKEWIYLPPHKFEVVFRERRNERDWDRVQKLEKFHYRGKGLNRIVGRRTALIAEMREYGIVGYGVLSASVAIVSPRFKLLKCNFREQMGSGLINQIVRIPRIVIHPEFRSLNLGVLMAKHLVAYAREYWDINHYTPIMVEVIAAMTEYHSFFEKAGFIKVGYTTGYRGRGVIPNYGNGSFQQRNPLAYNFMINQKTKPYMVYPLSSTIKRKLGRDGGRRPMEFLRKVPRLKEPLKFSRLSIKYRIENGSTERTNIVKEVFGVDSEHAFSPVIEDFSLVIDPGDIVLITGASGSGKSTILKLLTTKRSLMKKSLEWRGSFPRIKTVAINVLDTDFDVSRPLIDQVRVGKDIRDAIDLLNSVGLTEAHLYIKRPNQISDGQRYRFAVAKLCDSEKSIWIADEFVSGLNSEMAAIASKGLRKLASKVGATLILAAPHIDGFVGSLLPNKLVKLKWGSRPVIYALKIAEIHQSEEEISLTVVNNGPLTLTGVGVGWISLTGSFASRADFSCLKPKEAISVRVTREGDMVNALCIRTAEGVGEILYRK